MSEVEDEKEVDPDYNSSDPSSTEEGSRVYSHIHLQYIVKSEPFNIYIYFLMLI